MIYVKKNDYDDLNCILIAVTCYLLLDPVRVK